MRIVKPMALGHLNRTIAGVGGYDLISTVIIAFSMADGSMIPDKEAVKLFYESVDEGVVLDHCSPKGRAEVLFFGNCTIPAVHDPTLPYEISFKVGGAQRSIGVFGPRFWVSERGKIVMKYVQSQGERRISLSPENAFGGPEHQPNPLGKGFNAVKRLEKGEEKVIPLPLLEDLDHLIESPEDIPPPVWYSPTPRDFQEIFDHAGNFEGNWFKERYPAMPEDFDPVFYNMAQRGSWSNRFFLPGESYKLEQIFPGIVAQGALPAFRVRMFMLPAQEHATLVETQQVKLDTVAFLPEKSLAFCIYRGEFAIGKDQLCLEVKNLVLAYEHQADEPRAFEHYDQAVKGVDAHPPDNSVYFDDGPLAAKLPDDIVEAHERERKEIEAKEAATAAARQKAIGAMAARQTGRPEAGQLPEAGDDEPKLKALQAKAQTMAAQGGPPSEEQINELKDEILAASHELAEQAKEQIPQEYRKQVEEGLPPPLPRHPSVLTEEVNLRLTAKHTSEVERQVLPLENSDKLLEQMDGARRIGGGDVTHWPVMVEKDARSFGMSFIRISKENPKFHGLDLADCRIENQELKAIDLTESFFERGVFEACQMSECNFTKTCFARAKFVDVLFTGCHFEQTNLQNASLESCRFEECTFQDADAKFASMNGAIISESKILDCTFIMLTAPEIVFDQCQIKNSSFVNCDFTKSSWKDVSYAKANFINPTMTQSRWEGGSGEGLVLGGAKLAESLFDSLKVKQLFIGRDSSLSKIRFQSVEVTEGGFNGVDMTGAHLSGCRFTDSDFSGCTLTGIDASKSVFTGSLFIGAKVLDADLTDAHMLRCRLRQCDFTGSDLTRACLFEADTSDAIFDKALLSFADFRNTEHDRRGIAPPGTKVTEA